MYDEYGNIVEEDYSVDDHRSVQQPSESDSASVNSVQKKQRKMMEELKKMDAGYNKLTRFVEGAKNKIEKKSIDLYGTNSTPGSNIRGAITGSYYRDFKVGSRDEDVFYKVAISTGECKNDMMFFFDTPEQYERAMYITIPPSEKEAWYAKFNNERAYRESQPPRKNYNYY
uniref:Uncharacterized protein n=1 Tax=viral metagenome TaxID=1070528 RepID=A0A6C0KGE0_9ZZZZ